MPSQHPPPDENRKRSFLIDTATATPSRLPAEAVNATWQGRPLTERSRGRQPGGSDAGKYPPRSVALPLSNPARSRDSHAGGPCRHIRLVATRPIEFPRFADADPPSGSWPVTTPVTDGACATAVAHGGGGLPSHLRRRQLTLFDARIISAL